MFLNMILAEIVTDFRCLNCNCKTGTSRHTSCECSVKTESNAGEHPESLHWIGSGEQHDLRVQVKKRKKRKGLLVFSYLLFMSL